MNVAEATPVGDATCIATALRVAGINELMAFIERSPGVITLEGWTQSPNKPSIGVLMNDSDVRQCKGTVWRLEMVGFRLECVVDRHPDRQTYVVRVVENGSEIHVEQCRSHTRLETLSGEYLRRFYRRFSGMA